MLRTLTSGMVRVLPAGMFLLAHAGLAQEAVVWTDAYSADPAAYSLPMDFPPQMRPQAEPKLARGTVRGSFLIAAGGRQLRIRFSNEESPIPLVIGAASVGIANSATGEPKGALRPLTFSGATSAVVPPGAPMLSDPIEIASRPFDRIVVSVYLPDGANFVALGGGTFKLAPGDQTAAPTLAGASSIADRPLVSGAVVADVAAVPIVVAMGDSITDGVRSSETGLAGYPEVLARRLDALPAKRKRIVLNAGIAGNRLLSSGWGRSALARLDRDVLRYPGVSHLLLLEGINDIGLAGAPLTHLETPATAEQLIAGYRQIIQRAHLRGIKVIGGTLTPFEGAFYHTPQKEAVRDAVNHWIRSAREFDAIVDFDMIVRDPAKAGRLRAEYDSGDHLHPSARGYRAMGEAIDLRLFR